tara:strand:- start:111 stop:608 length:498 start_codon:yes stop_codon:yes gene_type:complete
MLEILKKYFFRKEKLFMSILEKLKDLVEALEQAPEKQEPAEKQELPEEPPEVEEVEEPGFLPEDSHPPQEEEEIQEIPSYLECSQEETSLILNLLKEEDALKVGVANLILQFEQAKELALSQVREKRQHLLGELNNLRLEYGVPDEGYSVQLPSSQSDKVSFIKD